jgi:hypothetical protein
MASWAIAPFCIFPDPSAGSVPVLAGGVFTKNNHGLANGNMAEYLISAGWKRLERQGGAMPIKMLIIMYQGM